MRMDHAALASVELSAQIRALVAVMVIAFAYRLSTRIRGRTLKAETQAATSARWRSRQLARRA
jgi:hypothetical protein